jgi:hypothetical protein
MYTNMSLTKTHLVLGGGRTHNSDVSDFQQNPDLWVMGGAIIEKDLNINGTLIFNGNIEFGATIPVADDVLTYDGVIWAPAVPSGGGSTALQQAIITPDADINPFTPIPNARYICLNNTYSVDRTWTFTAAGLASLNMVAGDVITFYITCNTLFSEINASPSPGATANGVTSNIENYPVYGTEAPATIRCTGVGTYKLYFAHKN